MKSKEYFSKESSKSFDSSKSSSTEPAKPKFCDSCLGQGFVLRSGQWICVDCESKRIEEEEEESFARPKLIRKITWTSLAPVCHRCFCWWSVEYEFDRGPSDYVCYCCRAKITNELVPREDLPGKRIDSGDSPS